MKSIFNKSLVLLTALSIAFSPWVSIVQATTVPSAIPGVTASFSTSLASKINTSDTSMTLVSTETKDAASSSSIALNQDHLTGVFGFVIDQGTSNEEFVVGTVNPTTKVVSSMIRGVSVYGNTTYTELAKNHARGASVKISDHPVLAVLKRVLNGEDELNNPLVYKSGVGPLASGDLADKEYVLSVVSGGAVSFEKVVQAGTAGETVVAGNVVYLKASDNRWWKSDADLSTTVENVPLGIAQGSGTAGNAISGGVLISGLDSNQSGLTASSVYYASNTAGGLSLSAGTKEVTIGISITTTSIFLAPRYNQQLTEDEQDAIAGGSTFGTPSSTNKFITQDYNSSATGLPVVRTYTTVSSATGDSTTQFDITNPSGTTFRYTWDSTGTDPSLSLVNNPVGSLINFQTQNMNSANNGVFVVTGAGSNYVEVTNASGVAESNKTIGTGYIVKSGATGWTKPAGLKYVTVELVGGGGGGGTDGSSGGVVGAGGGGGGYSKKTIAASSLASTEYYLVGAGGVTDGSGRISSFGSYLKATGGNGASSNIAGSAGVGTLGDINTYGNAGTIGDNSGDAGSGGGSFFGGGTSYSSGGGGVGTDGNNYGGGASGGSYTGSSRSGGNGAKGVIILTEYYS